MTKKVLLIVLSAISFVSIAKASQWDRNWRGSERRIVLQMYGVHYRGQSVIPLKQELQQRGYSPRIFELESVRLIAKTKQGRGTAELVVGQDRSYPKTIMGNQRDFHNKALHTYDRVDFYNPSRYGSQGRWQMHLRGNFKVHKIVLRVTRKSSWDDDDRWERERRKKRDQKQRGGKNRGRRRGGKGRR